MPRKVILYIATSMDGYIAQPQDDLSFLSLVEQEGEDYGYAAFVQTVDAVLMGRKTYDKDFIKSHHSRSIWYPIVYRSYSLLKGGSHMERNELL